MIWMELEWAMWMGIGWDRWDGGMVGDWRIRVEWWVWVGMGLVYNIHQHHPNPQPLFYPYPTISIHILVSTKSLASHPYQYHIDKGGIQKEANLYNTFE